MPGSGKGEEDGRAVTSHYSSQQGNFIGKIRMTPKFGI